MRTIRRISPGNNATHSSFQRQRAATFFVRLVSHISHEHSFMVLEGSSLYKWTLFLQSPRVTILPLLAEYTTGSVNRKSEHILDRSRRDGNQAQVPSYIWRRNLRKSMISVDQGSLATFSGWTPEFLNSIQRQNP